ncbi:MAG: hypothetical protein EOP84_10230 [Verrucomicrobiaceae bacterium]|nr:MAG: hypothetical protein EOP84_10230 [Verrucomicrobiaceae bacterium]
MNTTNLMNDPFYVPILFAIERRIGDADAEAKQEGISLTDSQVRSVLNRVRKSTNVPDLTAGTRRDQILAKLQKDLGELGPSLYEESILGSQFPLSTTDWHLSLRCVEDSIKLRSSGSGSRQYLDYVGDFLMQGGRA